MAYRYYSWCHSVGVHMYLIPSLIILAVILCVGITIWRNKSKREKEFKEELEIIKRKEELRKNSAEGSQL